MSRYAKLTTSLIAVWFAFSIVASALGLYSNTSNLPPLHLGIAALAPIAIFLAWFALSPDFRAFLMSLSPRTLALVQGWRVGGFVFIVLASFRMLPWLFALPAGLGDMTVGATAAFVALNYAAPAHRAAFIRWQLFGIADLVVAVSLGTLAGILNPHGIPTTVMTVLPMSMIPTFAVPVLLILHIISIAQARRWPATERPPLRTSLSSSAA
jgi:hypothetical protein